MDARLVGECVSPDDGLVGLHHHPRHGGHQLRRLVDLLGVDVRQGHLRQHLSAEVRVVICLPISRNREGGGEVYLC